MKGHLTFIFLSISLCLVAQVSQPARWEQENKYFDETYSIVSLKEEGLALIRDKEKFQDGKRIWDLILLDTVLQEKWTTELYLHDELRFVGYEYAPGKLNLMFRRNQLDFLKAEVLILDLATRDIQYSKMEVNLKIRLTHYTVVDNNSVFGGYVDREPVLIIHDPAKNNSFIVPGFFLTDTELLDVRPNRNGTFSILLSTRTQGKKKLVFRTFDKAGNILVEDEIPIDDDRTILNGVVSVLEHDEVMIAGSYTFKNEKFAYGIFSCLIDPFIEQPIRYEEFHQFRHFLDYLSDKKAEKIRDKAAERVNYGKLPGFKTTVGIHRIEEFKGGFAVFGESFVASNSPSSNAFSNPYYNSTSRTFGAPYAYTPFSNRYYNNPYQYPNNSTFSTEEMRMLESFVIGYDFKGRRLWDYSIPMGELKVAGREQVSDFVVVRDVPNFLFKDDNDLKFSVQNSDTLETTDPRVIPIRAKNQTEQVKNNDEVDGYVRHWYGVNLYVWGIQNVKDTQHRTESRRVFYINKIKVE
jgi:hypothetical protein